MGVSQPGPGWQGPWRIPLHHSPSLPQASQKIGLEGRYFPIFPAFEGLIFAGVALGRGCRVVWQGDRLRGVGPWTTSLIPSACGHSTLLLTPCRSRLSGWQRGRKTSEWRQRPPWPPPCWVAHTVESAEKTVASAAGLNLLSGWLWELVVPSLGEPEAPAGGGPRASRVAAPPATEGLGTSPWTGRDGALAVTGLSPGLPAADFL